MAGRVSAEIAGAPPNRRRRQHLRRDPAWVRRERARGRAKQRQRRAQASSTEERERIRLGTVEAKRRRARADKRKSEISQFGVAEVIRREQSRSERWRELQRAWGSERLRQEAKRLLRQQQRALAKARHFRTDIYEPGTTPKQAAKRLGNAVALGWVMKPDSWRKLRKRPPTAQASWSS